MCYKILRQKMSKVWNEDSRQGKMNLYWNKN
jgi:hypothetical protein